MLERFTNEPEVSDADAITAEPDAIEPEWNGIEEGCEGLCPGCTEATVESNLINLYMKDVLLQIIY
ncbi:hypothetical protein ACIQ2D_21425 [Lysinibacillus sp. NPDC097287]|uniref:hypothetical protein n=1 Tax=Lysinibacillus sp. NPDC097287 TaxID=3364144 RepID=UPI003823E23D